MHRALEIFETVPPGCVLHLQDDGAHEPHIHVGEWAVVDPAEVNIVAGELYLIGWPRCARQSRTIMQVTLDGETVSFRPLNSPQSRDELEEWIRERRPLYVGERGLRVEYLPEYVKGRIIGIYKAPERMPATSLLTFR